MKTIALFSVGAVLLSTHPAVAEGTAPVTIKCVVHRDAGSTSTYNPGIAYTNGVTVTLANTTSKDVKMVSIYGTYGGTMVSDDVDKTIPAGGTVEVTKAHTQLPYHGPGASCHVKKVVFTDGTSWMK